METATASVIAGSVSAVVAALSATIAAFSSRNSWRSARASEAALHETRRQRRADDLRRELVMLGVVHDEATALIKALAIDLRSEPAAVDRCRAALRRSMMLSGLTANVLVALAEARQPLSPAETDAVYRYLVRGSEQRRAELGSLTGRPDSGGSAIDIKP